MRPTGNIVITGDDGSEYEVKVGRGFPVYPEKRLSYAIKWNKTNLPPGRYEAHVRLDYGNIYDEERIVERTVSFVMEEDGSISY